MTKVRTRSNSASASVPVSKQVKIQFQDEGLNLGEKGTADVVNFVGSAVSVVRVGDTIVITITGGGTGSATFIGLTDVPATYVGQSLKLTRVNAAENALEFVTAGAGTGDVVGPASAVADRIAVFDSTTGKLIKDGGVTVAGLQPIDADLTAISALTSAADKLPYATGAGTWALTDLSSFIRTLLDDANLAAAQSTLGITAGWSRVTIVTPVVNNNGTPDTLADVTDLKFPVVANKKFAFRFFIIFDSAATTTGSRWTLNGPALTELDCSVFWSTSVSATQSRQITTYDSSVLSAASALAGNTCELYGIIECSAIGDVIARFSSEIAGSAITVLEASFVEYVQLD